MPTVVLLWVWFCAYLNCAGWALSAIHELNAGGYAVALLLWMVALFVWQQKTSAQIVPRVRWKQIHRRFRRPFPLAFLILAAMAFLGGALYPPTNYDALAYRTPRVLHWLAAGQWRWIHTDFQRLNTRGCGIEWVTAPLFLFTGTDRFVFLINVICFLLLPGRFFSVLVRLGVRTRTAWHWMWLLPAGYCYLLQAGSIANDLFGAVFAMVAIEFALRARQKKRIGDLWLSVFAAGLMTASKSFNILLLLPWGVAVLPALCLLLRRPIISALVVVMAAGASLAPTALLNLRNCGDWTGLKAEQPLITTSAPIFHLTVNAVLLVRDNLAPPIFPFSGAWSHLMQQVIPASVSVRLQRDFEPGVASLEIGEMQMEERAGLGFGLSILLLFVLLSKMKHSRNLLEQSRLKTILRHESLVSLSAGAAILVFLVQSGLNCPARYLAPFYVLLIAPILAGAAPLKMTRNIFWHAAGIGTFLLAGLLVVLSPPRPLWPAVAVLRALGAGQSKNHLLQRAWTVYSVYDQRAGSFATVLAALPPDANPLGFVGWDEPEAALWQPFGSRRILHICRADTVADTRARGIKYALVCERTLSDRYAMKLDDWLTSKKAEPIRSFQLRLRAGKEPYGWALVKFEPPSMGPRGKADQN